MTHLQVIRNNETMGMGLADYVWPDDEGEILFKKKSILIGKDDKGDPVPLVDRWTFDWSGNTEQGSPDDSAGTRILVPCFYLPDPTQPQPSYIVLCEARDCHDHCIESNWRAKLRNALDVRGKQTNLVWFGFEQDYQLYEATREEDGFEARAFNVAERHIGACFDAGLLFHSAWNPPRMVTWDFKVGYRGFPQDLDPDPPNALVVADHLMVARYLMEKIGGASGLIPIWKDLSIFVSTSALREPGGNHLAEANRIKNAVSHLGEIRPLVHPTRGGFQCLEVSTNKPECPYELAHEILTTVWLQSGTLNAK